MQTKISRFAETVVSLAKKAVTGEPALAYRLGKDGYADWVILAVQGFKKYLNHDYRKLMDVWREMPRVAESLNLTVEMLPHFSTICARKQDILLRRIKRSGLIRAFSLTVPVAENRETGVNLADSEQFGEDCRRYT